MWGVLVFFSFHSVCCGFGFFCGLLKQSLRALQEDEIALILKHKKLQQDLIEESTFL